MSKRLVPLLSVQLLGAATGFLGCMTFSVQAQETLEEITVYGSTPLGRGIQAASLPHAVQSFAAEDLQNSTYTSIADFLNRQANGVTINQAQNNLLQPDVQIRGFSASPLLGASQGVAVYVNGARVNEAFGDTVNWDLLSPNTVERLDLIQGTNAVYGLNALGASLAITTKTGFNHDGSQIEASTGSFGRHQISWERGQNWGDWASYIAVSGLREDGWRDFSPTDAANLYGAVSFNNKKVSWDVFGFWADTELRGNGTAPELLLARDRTAVFTHPDITENHLAMISSRVQINLDNDGEIVALGFFRDNNTDSFNGDGSEFSECDPPLTGFLCDDDDTSENVSDQFGNAIPIDFDAINNISERNQQALGLTLEISLPAVANQDRHHHTLGLDWYQGNTDFQSAVEFAQLQSDRSTNRSGLFDNDGSTALNTKVRTLGVSWVDHVNVNANTLLDLSLRYNHSDISTRDDSGEAPELTASHTFQHVNAGIGVMYRVDTALSVFANLHQSARTPSPVELACSHPDAPCTLPNTFLADPPLEQIVARNLEFGLRHQTTPNVEWELSTFITAIKDDIIFQSTGGVSSNEGFFDNVSATRRLGLSSTLNGTVGDNTWQIRYTWLAASYADDFFVSSPNHPAANNDVIPVHSGDALPGLSEHVVHMAWQQALRDNITWRIEGTYQSGVYLRGDEGNLDDKTNDYLVLNTTISYQPADTITLYFAINNLLDEEYETFGLYGEPDQVIPSLGDENTRFLSPSEPRGAWLGARYRF